LETIDFLERLAPFTEPELLVRDKLPDMAKHNKIAETTKPKKEEKIDALQMLLDSQE
jgi:hypothetical protein